MALKVCLYIITKALLNTSYLEVLQSPMYLLFYSYDGCKKSCRITCYGVQNLIFHRICRRPLGRSALAAWVPGHTFLWGGVRSHPRPVDSILES